MKKNKKIWIMFLFFAAAVSFGVWYYLQNKKQNVMFEVVVPQHQTIVLQVNASGIVQPQNRLEIKPPINGRLESILVREGENVKKGQILAWMSSIERAALLDVARAQGSESFKRWQQIYKPAPIVAPMSGTIIARNAESGQTITTQDIPLVMSDRLIIKAQVDETDIGKIKIGQNVLIVPDAYADKTVQGKITHIAFEATTVNNVTIYEVDVLPKYVPDFMRSGMTVNVTAEIEKKENVLALSTSLIKEQGGEYFVQVLESKKNKEPKNQKIEIGLSDGKYTEVLKGIDKDSLVLSDNSFLQNKNNERNRKNNPFSPYGSGRKR